jgi:type VI secretion system protein ImpA
MPSPSIINISALISPISSESTIGDDIRLNSSYDSNYSKIKDARRAARDAERNNLFDGDTVDAQENWHKIYILAPKVIAEESKDLEIACWLTEALVRKSGFQGLRDGFTLIRQLIENYWDDGLYPSEDEDGIETRVAPVAGLNGEGADGVLLSPIRNSFITEDVSAGQFNLWQYKQAVDISRMSDERNQSAQIEKVGFCLEDIEKAVAQSSTEYYAELFEDIEICLVEYRAINSLLTELCGTYDAPPTSKIIELIEDAKSALNHIAKLKLPVINTEIIVEENDDSLDASQENTTNSVTTTSVSTALNSRDDAFKQLDTIAEYFRKTEPHSPISYILTKAIKWGNMPLEELMKELIPDSSSRDVYGSLTGVSVDDS